MALDIGGAASLATLATLMVKIKADSSELEGGLKSATDKLNKFSNITLGLGGAITGAFGTLIKEAVDAGSAMSDMSVRTGVAVEDCRGCHTLPNRSGLISEFRNGLKEALRIRMDDNAQKVKRPMMPLLDWEFQLWILRAR